MIIFLISTIILLYGVAEYRKGCKANGLLIFFFFLTNGFHLINDEWYGSLPISKSTDFAILYLIYVLFIEHFFEKKFFKPVFINYKWILLLFFYISINFCITILLEQEQIGYSIKVFRTYIPLLSFLLIQELSAEELKGLINQIIKIVFITVLLHVSQLFTGIQTLQHTNIQSGAEKITGIARYRNIPYLGYFLLIYFTVALNLKNYKTFIYLLICIVSLLMSQHRGPMIGYVVVVVMYLLMTKQIGKSLLFLIIGLLIFAFAGDFLKSRFESENTGSDIRVVLSMNANTTGEQYDRHDMGNLTFRILLLKERIDYLIENPIELIKGVGLRHEDSPLTKREFHFFLGTNKPNPKGFWEPAQINSADLAWQTPLMQLGILGVFLFLIITIMNIKFLFRYRNTSNLAMAAFLFYIFLITISFKNDHLFGRIQICFLLMIVEYFRKSEIYGSDYENIDSNLFKRV